MDSAIYRGTFLPPIFSASVTDGSVTSQFQYVSCLLLLHQWLMTLKTYWKMRLLVLVLEVFNDSWYDRKAIPNRNSWVHEEDMHCITPDLLDGYLQANSPGPSFSKLGRDDGFIKTYFRKKYKNNN